MGWISVRKPKEKISIHTQIFPLLPKAPPAFLLVWFGRFYSVLSSWGMPLLRPPQFGILVESWSFCTSQKKCHFESCVSHSRRNWTDLPVFCEKYINDKGLWKVILQFVAWPFLQWWEFIPAFFRKEVDQDFDKYWLNYCTELRNKTGYFCSAEIIK